jgi:hypothetical protein
MKVLQQDMTFAFRQLRNTPGFAVTVLLTLALGIGANSAVFTLVNAILLHNLPVRDPKSLVRIGDKDDCCVNGGWNDDGAYSLFSTDTYYMFKKSLPEFEELAAIESGYAWRPVTVAVLDPRRWRNQSLQRLSRAITSGYSVFHLQRAGYSSIPMTRRERPSPPS